jgi:hypothetical protein
LYFPEIQLSMWLMIDRDGKKLTFYYFADTYINFNSLVTDLFKVYKTRIWMSAINPASFQTPTSSLGIQPAFGGHAHGHSHGLGAGRDSPAGRRRQYGGQAQQQPQALMGMGFGDSFDHDRFTDHNNTMGMRNSFMNQYTPFPPTGMPQVGPGMAPFGAQAQDPMDGFGQYSMYSQTQYGMLNPTAPTFSASGPMRGALGSRGAGSGQGGSPANDWTSRFQGLSLNSQ